MSSILFVIVVFTAISGIALVAIEIHRAPLMADDEMTVITEKT